eukprot:gene5137-34944_t
MEQNTAMKTFREHLAKSHEHFNKLRDLPTYGSWAWERCYHQAFEVFSSLWIFQQDNRQALVEAGLQRPEIGEIASKIGQAIHTRQYFTHDGLLSSNPQLCIKQLRFYARFIIVCLLMNKKEDGKSSSCVRAVER